MQTPHSQIEEQPNLIVHPWERNTEELQDNIERCLPSLYRRAYRYLGNSHDAEDAVQEALLSAYKHLDQFKGNAKMTTWLTSIVTNSALSQLRRRPRQFHSSLDYPLAQEPKYSLLDELAGVRPSPEDECVTSELHGHLAQFVRELPPTLRVAIQLRDLDGLTTSEAAQKLGVPEGTIKARVWRARARLKRNAKLGLRRTTTIARVHTFDVSEPATN
jgi:RNA polymerase sigma-70 factor (ECF subfamily)